MTYVKQRSVYEKIQDLQSTVQQFYSRVPWNVGIIDLSHIKCFLLQFRCDVEWYMYEELTEMHLLYENCTDITKRASSTFTFLITHLLLAPSFLVLELPLLRSLRRLPLSWRVFACLETFDDTLCIFRTSVHEIHIG